MVKEVHLVIKKGKLVCLPEVLKANVTTVEKWVIKQETAKHQVVEHI